LPPSAVLNLAVQGMTRSGYGLEARVENVATFARHQGPNVAFGILFTLLCCVLRRICSSVVTRYVRTRRYRTSLKPFYVWRFPPQQYSVPKGIQKLGRWFLCLLS
jgi:hypothetical protein